MSPNGVLFIPREEPSKPSAGTHTELQTIALSRTGQTGTDRTQQSLKGAIFSSRCSLSHLSHSGKQKAHYLGRGGGLLRVEMREQKVKSKHGQNACSPNGTWMSPRNPLHTVTVWKFTNSFKQTHAPVYKKVLSVIRLSYSRLETTTQQLPVAAPLPRLTLRASWIE